MYLWVDRSKKQKKEKIKDRNKNIFDRWLNRRVRRQSKIDFNEEFYACHTQLTKDRMENKM